MADDKRRKRETDYLNLPPSSPLSDTGQGQVAPEFGENWRLQLKIDNQKLTLPVYSEISVGRSVEGDTASRVDVDLNPQGAYQSGVSRRHALIRRHSGALYLEDLNSTNGTRINGAQVTPGREYRLRDGDEIEFGRVRVIIRFVAS
ncbi:MAG: FHA domain-containing protein [Anaerolineae bacterium]|jgi:pSer/pThr/pTyr-binding forkhead associated (FHA) protein|nr:FHA domain-containing protein [Anaerolineae bacterium]